MSNSTRVIPVSPDGKLQPSLGLVLHFFCLYFLNGRLSSEQKSPNYRYNQNLLLRNVNSYKTKWRELGGSCGSGSARLLNLKMLSQLGRMVPVVPVIEPSTLSVVSSPSFLLYPPKIIIISFIGHFSHARGTMLNTSCV